MPSGEVSRCPGDLIPAGCACFIYLLETYSDIKGKQWARKKIPGDIGKFIASKRMFFVKKNGDSLENGL